MKKYSTLIFWTLMLLLRVQAVQAQNHITYGIIQEPADPLLFTAVAYPNFSSTNVTISTALFTFYLPAGTVTTPAVPVLPLFGSFYDSTGIWRIEKITPAYYASFGFNPADLMGNDIYQCILQNSPSPAALVSGQALKLFSFRLPNNCTGGQVQVHINDNAIRQALLMNFGININNQMSISVDDAPSVDLYFGNNPLTDNYDCPFILSSPPVAVNDAANTTQNTPVTINVLANDSSPTSSLNPNSVTIITPPLHGGTVVNAGGTVTYTPTNGFIGQDSFVYQVCDIQVPPQCDQATVYIQVNAACTVTPVVNDPPDQVVCNGNPTTTVTFTGNVQNATYSWTNNTTSIGLAASGTGNIPSFNAVNTGTAPVVATIMVTPSYVSGGITCMGSAQAFTITVNPTPNVTQPANQIVCAGDLTTLVNFTTTVAGTVFNWTNNNTAIGLAASGSGNIAAFVATNNTNAPITGIVIVTPSFTNAGVTCTGVPRTFTITVNPRATVTVGADLGICQNQTAFVTATIGGSATGGSWASSGSGTFANPAATATSYTPSAADYGQTITLTFTTNDPAGPCPAASDALLLTISTLPIVDAGSPGFVCPGDVLNLSTLGASILPNGSGVTTGTWSTSGTGTFSPSNAFPAATTYTPSAADIAFGSVQLTLTSADPAGPCLPASDQVVLTIHKAEPIVCNDLVYVSLDIDCVNEILPDDILEGTYQLEFYEVLLYNLNNVPLPGGNVVTAANVGQTLLVKVFDICTGNFCWGHLVVEDKLSPTIDCEDITLSCAITNYEPNYLQNVLNLDNAYPDVFDCSAYTLTYIDVWHDLSCGQGFNNHPDLSAYVERKWTATDAWGNTSTCLQYIYFERLHISDVLFPADVTISCTENVNTSPSNTGAPYIDDFGLVIPLFPNNTWCEMQAAYVDQVLPVCDGTYKILRTWTVIDWCLPTSPFPPTSNPLYYIQLIKIVDDQGPVLACPNNLTVSTDPFTCCATTDLPDIIIEDNCSRINNISAMVITFDQYTGQQGAMYVVGGTLTTFPGNNLWDLDTLGNWGYTPCLPEGTHTVIYTVTDDCGNTSTCSFQLTVADNIPPVAACDEFTIVAIGIDDPFDCYTPADGCDGAGVTWVKATTFDDGSYDNCNNVHFTVRRMEPYSDCITGLDPDCEYPTAIAELDSIKFYCCEVGTTQTVILRVYQVDLNGQYINGPDGTPIYNECMVNVEVQDKIKPVCLPPAHVTVACENFDPSFWVYGLPNIADNCCLDTTKVYQNQCGLTHTVNYSQFDTVCNKGTIIRTFRAFDCHGQSSQCTQRIVVQYNQDYFIKFPNDVIVTVCDGTGNYGEPVFYGKDCELLGVNYEDVVYTVVPDACFKIERTWTIINWCTYNPNLPCIEVPNPNPNPIANHAQNLPGPTVSACGTLPPWAPTIVKINPSDPTATNFCTFWDADANCYKYKQIIKIIDTQDPVAECPASPVEFCDLTPNNPQLWNEMYWWDNVISSHDLCEAPTDLCITGTDACSGANINIHYLLFLDLDGDGTMETVVNSNNTGIAGLGWNNVNFGNAGNPNFSGGTPRAFDERPVPANQKWGFAIQTTVSGNNRTACVRWNTQQSQNTFVVPELPYGTHKIKWFVEDGCGNETVCEYTFIVKDCKKPTVVCLNGLSVNIMPTGMITLWANDFLQYTDDNCTPSDQLKIAIRKSGTGTGFPVDANGNPITSVTFTCDELGTQLVELWSIDAAGNADFCETYVIVQDNMGVCPPNPANGAKVAGVLATEVSDGLEEGSVDIEGSSNAVPSFAFTTMSNGTGLYNFNGIPLASNSTVTPLKDDNHLNGVSTYDLVLISKHILGLLPLNSPYKMISADANKNSSITTTDIVEIRKLILGIYTEFPNNTSWRFVDADFAFPNPQNPFTTQFPENKDIVNLSTDQVNEDFVSMKIGDVNGSAMANATMSAEDRSVGTLLFDVEDRAVKAGEIFTVQFKAAEYVQGYQFTINLAGLEVENITPGADMKASNFAVFNDAITTSFDVPATSVAASAEFAISFRATKSGRISDMLGVSSRITKAEAYSIGEPASAEASAGKKLDVAFRFNQGGVSTIAGLGFELYQNQPNPFVNKTVIGFHLPEATEATLSIFDEMGRLVYTGKGDFAKGYNAFTIDRALVGTTGALFYKVETATDTATKSMIQSK